MLRTFVTDTSIKHPVQIVFNCPVCALKLEQPISRYIRMAAWNSCDFIAFLVCTKLPQHELHVTGISGDDMASFMLFTLTAMDGFAIDRYMFSFQSTFRFGNTIFKATFKCSASNRLNTSPSTSCDGIPCSGSGNSLNFCSRVSSNSCMPTETFALQKKRENPDCRNVDQVMPDCIFNAMVGNSLRSSNKVCVSLLFIVVRLFR